MKKSVHHVFDKLHMVNKFVADLKICGFLHDFTFLCIWYFFKLCLKYEQESYVLKFCYFSGQITF